MGLEKFRIQLAIRRRNGTRIHFIESFYGGSSSRCQYALQAHYVIQAHEKGN